MSVQMELDLPGGTQMPIHGLGTWQSKDEDVRRAVETALDLGYNLIDTAISYRNEKVIGQVLEERFDSGKLKREDIFITTKIPGVYMGSKESVSKGMSRSLKDLGLKYVDLLLIHFPVGLKLQEDENLWPQDENGKLLTENKDIIETWKGLEALVDQGLAKAIGLSNFNSKQIERIHKIARHPIANNQVELHAYFPQNKLFDFCKQRNITVTAYAPLGSPGRPKVAALRPDAPVPLTDPVVADIAKKHSKTPAQVLLRNLMQRGIAVIPKSVTPGRIKENIEVFDFHLSEEEMKAIADLDRNTRLFVMDTIGGEMDEYPFREEF